MKTLKDAALPGVTFEEGGFWSISAEAAAPFYVEAAELFVFPKSSKVEITGVGPGEVKTAKLRVELLAHNVGPWPIQLADDEVLDGDFAGNVFVAKKGEVPVATGDLKAIEAKLDRVLAILEGK